MRKIIRKITEAVSRCHVAGESTIFIEFMLSQIDKIPDDNSG